jgi:hypothetical protein
MANDDVCCGKMKGWLNIPFQISHYYNEMHLNLTLSENLLNSNFQVFLWLQEKGLFGEGSLLYNPTPGIISFN